MQEDEASSENAVEEVRDMAREIEIERGPAREPEPEATREGASLPR
jgi:hypothetical protein